jgi:hypothetical protein
VDGRTCSEARKTPSWKHRRWAYIAPPEINIGPRRPPEESNEGPSRVSNHDAPNRGTTSRKPPSCRPNTESRLSPGDNTNSKRVGDNASASRRRLQGGERHPRVPSPPARQKPCRFSSDRRTSPHLEGIGQHRPSSLAPPPPQHLAVVAAKPITAERPHGREKRSPTNTSNLAEEQQPPHTSGKGQDRPRRPSPTPRDDLATTPAPRARIRPD